MAGISNVRIGGKRARKDKRGRWTTKKKRWKKEEVVKKPEPSKVAPVIKLKPKKKEGVVKKVAGTVKKVFNLKTSAEAEKGKPVDIKAGTLPITPAGAATATVSAAVHAHKLIKTGAGAEKLIGIGTRTATRNFIGRPGTTGKWATKLFNSIGSDRARVATRFATNTKSAGLTKSFAQKAGMGVGAAALVVTALGTLPFAGFIKEEALQTVGMGFFQASQNDNIEGMEMAIAEQEELLNPSNFDKLISVVPFANVMKELKGFYKAARVKLEIDKQNLEIKKAEEAAVDEESEFEKSRREAQVKEAELDIRQSEVWALRREGKYDEADELEKQILADLQKTPETETSTDTKPKPKTDPIKL